MNDSPPPADPNDGSAAEDVPAPDAADVAEGAAPAAEGRTADGHDEVAKGQQAAQNGPPGPQGMFAELEEGFGHLIAAFERGVINIADAEGKKRRGEAGSGSPKQAKAKREPEPPRAPRRGMTYEEALAPRSERRRMRAEAAAAAQAARSSAEQPPGPELDGADPDAVESADAEASSDAGEARPIAKRQRGDAVFEPIPARPGTTYEEVLSPIRWRNLAVGAGIALVLAVLYWGATFLQVWSSVDDDQTQPVDAIVVLGAAQFDGTPSPVLAARLDHALDLWNDDLANFIMTTGSNQEGDRFTEGFSGFVYLREAGVPEESILTIVDGADTYQQLSASAAQMRERELESALLVSDGYHNHRLQSIADELGLEAYVSPTSIEPTTDDYLRETTAVSVGRLVGYRRLSSWANPNDEIDQSTEIDNEIDNDN